MLHTSSYTSINRAYLLHLISIEVHLSIFLKKVKIAVSQETEHFSGDSEKGPYSLDICPEYPDIDRYFSIGNSAFSCRVSWKPVALGSFPPASASE